MKLKSYFSETVESAMDLARKELGEEALLVHARPTTPETRYLGSYEVVFGLLPAIPSPVPPALAPEPSFLRGELDDLRRQIDRLTQSFDAPPRPVAPNAPGGLQQEELDVDVVRKIAAGARLEDLVSVDATLRPVVVLVGPPGVGKTTTLIKLAVRYGLARQRSVHILTTDVYRIAAADQLLSLAAILGIGCDAAETPGSLAQRLDEQKARDLILIDTPGFSQSDLTRDAHAADELASVVSAHPGIDTHLVLSAAMKPADMARIADQFQVFKPSKVLFTRLDETTRYGALANEAIRRALPVSFLTNGQRIPDDLEEASTRRICGLVLGERPVLASRGAAA
jgi:flagellar biosynthesis protein FlhF